MTKACTRLRVLLLTLHVYSSVGLQAPRVNGAFSRRTQLYSNSGDEPEAVVCEQETTYDASVASKFKVLTCSASSCAAKRRVLGMDEFSTFSSFWVRANERMPEIQVEETSCLGACKKAPCVGIEHLDYEGTVALEGMDSFEFSDRVFHRVIDESDAERAWTCLENAVTFMMNNPDDGDD